MPAPVSYTHLPFGIYPNNAIVGGSGTIAMGAALYKRVNRKPGIVVANIGDGALGRGPVLEALNMSGMGQLNTLWEDDMKGGLPVLFNIFTNQYGMGGQTSGCLLYTSGCRASSSSRVAA